MSAQPFGEYRGCVLLIYPEPLPIKYGSPCTTYLRFDIARVKADIDAKLGPIEPPEEPEPPPPTEPPGDSTVYVETYREWIIWYVPHIPIYHVVSPVGVSFQAGNVEEARAGVDAAIAQDEQPTPPPPPPDQLDPDDSVAAVYGDITIYFSASTGLFYFTFMGTLFPSFLYVQDATAFIDNVLGIVPVGPSIVPGDEPSYTPMDKDPARAAAITGPIQAFLTSVGLTPEALEAVRGSGADPAKAAQFAQSVALASVGAISILGTIGVVAEVASLGQIETVHRTIDMVLGRTGIGGLLEEMFRLPFMAALVAPARHYWNSVYTPEIPGSGDLITFLVREIITPEEFNETMALHGFSQKWADDYWEAHWRLPSIGDIIRAEHLGIITREERDTYFILHDYRSDARPGITVSDLAIYGGLTKTLLGRVDTRRAYQYGYLERPALIEMYQALGYEEDSELQADIQIRASVDGLQSAIRRETGMMYRDRLKDARKDESTAVGIILADRNTKLVDLGNATIAGEYTEEESLVIEADIRAKAEVMIAEVREKARAREEEVEVEYRTALEEVKDLIDPTDLWVMRYKLAAARVEVAEEFEITPPVEVVETPEEPE